MKGSTIRQPRHRNWPRSRAVATIVAAVLSALGVLLPATFVGGASAAASPAAPSTGPIFTSAPAATFLTDTNTRYNVSAVCNVACTFAVAGSLPSGVIFTSQGLLAGVPAYSTIGVYSFTITATDSVGTATQDFTLTVEQPAAIGVEGTDGQLWAQAPQLGLGWHPLGGAIIAPPAVAATQNPNPDLSGTTPTAPVFVATGSDHRLWIRSLTAGWQLLGPATASCLDGPAAAITGTFPNGPFTLTVACRGMDNALWINTATLPSSGLPQLTTKWTSLGGVLSDGPAAALVGSVVRFFVRGTDARIYTRTLSSAYAAMTWSCIGQPAAVKPPNVPYTVFACQGADHALWYTSGSPPGGPSDWINPASLSGSLIGGPAVAATNGPYLLAEGADHAVWERTELAGWISLGGTAVGGVGAAALD